MNTISSGHLDQCLLEMRYCFTVSASRKSHLSEPVMGGRIVLIYLQRCPETFSRIVQTIEFQKDVTEVYRHGYVVRSQRARELKAANSFLVTTLLLIELRK